jgi:hypothetical protein
MKSTSIGRAGVWVVAAALCAAAPQESAENVQYPLTAKNGPWMVLVKGFQGPEAIEMANRLASELRKDHKIPTYVYVKSAPPRSILPAGYQKGRERHYEQAAVLAGDFSDEKGANKLRDKVRAIKHVKSIPEESTSRHRWRKGVLSTAFLTTNPLAPKGPAEEKGPDPVLLKLNAGKHSLYNCPGQYSLQVITFSGAVAYTEEQQKKLEETSMLKVAGERAELVAAELRKQGLDAYFFHGLSSSMVCVGGFSSYNDPQIEPLRRQLAGNQVKLPGTPAQSFRLSPFPIPVKVPTR